MKRDIEKDNKKIILDNIRKMHREYVLFYFPDSEAKYHDEIRVQIKRCDFNKLLSDFSFDYQKLNNTYKGYNILISILKAYDISYTVDSFDIEW